MDLHVVVPAKREGDLSQTAKDAQQIDMVKAAQISCVSGAFIHFQIFPMARKVPRHDPMCRFSNILWPAPMEEVAWGEVCACGLQGIEVAPTRIADWDQQTPSCVENYRSRLPNGD